MHKERFIVVVVRMDQDPRLGVCETAGCHAESGRMFRCNLDEAALVPTIRQGFAFMLLHYKAGFLWGLTLSMDVNDSPDSDAGEDAEYSYS